MFAQALFTFFNLSAQALFTRLLIPSGIVVIAPAHHAFVPGSRPPSGLINLSLGGRGISHSAFSKV